MNEKLVKLWNNPLRTPTLVGIVAFNAGVALGYFLGKRSVPTLEHPSVKKYKKNLEHFSKNQEGIETSKIIVDRTPGVVRNKPTIVNDPPLSSPELAKKGKDFIVETISSPPKEEELVTRSIFSDEDDDWNYDLEVKKRQQNQDGPHVLHKDEFYENEKGFTQITLTYYAGDNILVDEDDTPIYNHELVTGPMMFGHGSGDPNVFYVRNIKRKAEYEILRDDGLYSVEVLGLDIENNTRVRDLKHANSPGKFRSD